MQYSEAYHWLKQGKRRRKILLTIRQPMTARQLSKHTEITLDTCSLVLKGLAGNGLVTCLNGRARRSRLYWLTQPGKECQSRLRRERGLGALRNDFPIMDWELYGWVCFSHRAAVLTALREPMQPAQIKRVARSQNPALKMSANNVRDVVRLFLERGITERVPGVKNRSHSRYQLTKEGAQLRVLLMRANENARNNQEGDRM